MTLGLRMIDAKSLLPNTRIALNAYVDLALLHTEQES